MSLELLRTFSAMFGSLRKVVRNLWILPGCFWKSWKSHTFDAVKVGRYRKGTMAAFLEIFFSWVGGFVIIGLEIQAGYLGSPPPGWPLIKCIKLQQRSAVLDSNPPNLLCYLPLS